MKHLHYFFNAFFSEGFIAFFSLSLFCGALGWLFATSSVGQYFSSTMHAHDLQRSAHWTGSDAVARQPVVVLIDDAGYERFFAGQSPVSRARMQELLETIAAHTPTSSRIALDIDLSPVAAQAFAQADLEAFLLQQPERWVLPATRPAVLGSPQDLALAQWRQRLCARGVGFGLPYVPTEFGYPSATNQYAQGLAHAATQEKLPCADPTQPFVTRSMPLQGAMLNTGVVIPFSGDLQQLAQMLDGLQPSLVFVGGGWGHLDLMGTPFGERYGVQVHAAAAAGVLGQERMATPLQEMVFIWIVCGLIGALRGLFYEAINQERIDELAVLPGHQFWRNTGRPILFFVWVFFLVIGLSEVTAVVHGQTGYWVSSGNVAVFVLCSVLMSWGGGRWAPQRHTGFSHAWRDMVIQPIQADVNSVVRAGRALLGPVPSPSELPRHAAPITRWESLREGLLSVARLATETLLPMASLYYALKELA